MKQRKGLGFMLVLLLSFFTLYGMARMIQEWCWKGDKVKSIYVKAYDTREVSTAFTYQHAIVRQMVRKQEENIPVLKPASPQKVFKQVSISGRESKVENVSALQNLFLTIHNGSSYVIEQVQVEVEFLDKAGKSIGGKIIPIDKLKPSTNTLIQVPYCKHGTKVKYKIMNIYMPSRMPLQKLS